ncbi:hypothetical protein [Enterobacter cloacae]|uniref:hypothetical protein n=1 Tax=Enterobacter cloacae TaxID=550 RepID=UPI00101B08F1|nr:hypothetical protein [Enterobacter cloacae]QBC01883.1 hypothetical protein EWI30_07270 [Enterobacter cloacae]
MSNIDKQILNQAELESALRELKRISEQPSVSTHYARVLRKYIANLQGELEAAEKRIAEQRETLLAARSHVMQCARMGDAHANGVLQAIDRAAAGKGE